MNCEDTGGIEWMRRDINACTGRYALALFQLRGDIGPAGRSEEVLDFRGGAEGGAEFVHGLADGRVHPFPSDLRERDEDEGAVGKARMWHMQIGFVDHAVIV